MEPTTAASSTGAATNRVSHPSSSPASRTPEYTKWVFITVPYTRTSTTCSECGKEFTKPEEGEDQSTRGKTPSDAAGGQGAEVGGDERGVAESATTDTVHSFLTACPAAIATLGSWDDPIETQGITYPLRVGPDDMGLITLTRPYGSEPTLEASGQGLAGTPQGTGTGTGTGTGLGRGVLLWRGGPVVRFDRIPWTERDSWLLDQLSQAYLGLHLRNYHWLGL